MSHGRRILIILLSVLIVLFGLVSTVIFNSGKRESFWPSFSTFFTDDFGTHALFRLVEQQGYPVKKNFYSPAAKGKHPEENLVFIAPSSYFEEADCLLSEIQLGAWALIVPQDNDFPLTNSGIEARETEYYFKPYEENWGKSGPENSSKGPDYQTRKDSFYKNITLMEAGIYPELPDLSKIQYRRYEPEPRVGNQFHASDIRKINYDFQQHFQSDSTPLYPIFQSPNGEIHAAWAKIGQGGIVMVSHVYPFTNQGLKNPANVELVMFFFNFIAKRHPGAFVFDEYHHGMKKEKVELPIWFPEIRYMIWGLFACLCLAVYSGLRRPMRVIPVTREPRRSIVEFIQSMSAIYHRNNGTYFIFLDVCSRFLQRLRAVTGITEKDILSNPGPLLKAAEIKWGESETENLKQILNGIQTARSKQRGDLALIRRIREFSIHNKLDQHYHVK